MARCPRVLLLSVTKPHRGSQCALYVVKFGVSCGVSSFCNLAQFGARCCKAETQANPRRIKRFAPSRASCVLVQACKMDSNSPASEGACAREIQGKREVVLGDSRQAVLHLVPHAVFVWSCRPFRRSVGICEQWELHEQITHLIAQTLSWACGSAGVQYMPQQSVQSLFFPAPWLRA